MGKKKKDRVSEIAKGADESIDIMDSYKASSKTKLKKKLVIILVPLIIISIVMIALCVFYFRKIFI